MRSPFVQVPKSYLNYIPSGRYLSVNHRANRPGV
jgi:hypothetical protein